MLGLTSRHRCEVSRQRGLSLVEMMVGLTVGLIVVAGASMMMVGQIEDHRRLVLETQVQQDLRAAADLVLRDMRRAGYRQAAEQLVWASAPAAAAVTNAYATATATRDTGEVLYSYSRATSPGLEDNIVGADERFGFRVRDGVLQFLLGGSWQPLTDPNTMTVTNFVVALNAQTIALAEFCSRPCPVGADCPPRQQVRDVSVSLTGTAARDPKVIRNVRISARLRNDAVLGSC